MVTLKHNQQVRAHIKSQVSVKINAHCTATMVVTTQENNLIQVRVCHTHYGHSKSLGHLNLTTKDRQQIAGKLAQGVSFDKILNNIRESVDTKLSHIHLATWRDILNVERAYGLRSIEKHQNDALNVDAWVEELKANGDGNPILMYKPQGQIFSDTTFNLAKNNFCLAIQTKLQQMFKKFAKSHVVCIDSTHKTNGYDFPLITVLVADVFCEGYPVAWCISNREDKVVLIAFFEKLREVWEYQGLITNDKHGRAILQCMINCFWARNQKITMYIAC